MKTFRDRPTSKTSSKLVRNIRTDRARDLVRAGRRGTPTKQELNTARKSKKFSIDEPQR